MIYMTTDEWKEITKIIEEKDLKELVIELQVRTCDLDISKQELDYIIKDYKTNNGLALGLSPIVDIQDSGKACIIECRGHTYRFEFEQPISHCAVIANTEKKEQNTFE